MQADLSLLLAERKAVIGGQARYRYDLVEAARAFWDGGSLDEWIGEMDQVVQEGLWRAWLQGAAGVGVEEGDLNEEEQARFGEIVNEQMSYVDALGFFIQDLRQREGSFDQVLTRLELWANTYTEVVNEARVMAGRDTKLKWVLGPTEEHCFPAGTMVTMGDGSLRAIETVRVGEMVKTIAGIYTVTKTFCNPYSGIMVKVTADGHKVTCTANHPFLTQRGWVEAGALNSSDQLMLVQDGGDNVLAHVGLPDALYRIATGVQICVLRGVTALLGNLPISKRDETRMPMPIVPIGLDDEIADSSIHNELGLYQGERFALYAKLGNVLEEANLKFRRLVALDPLVPLCQSCELPFPLLRMVSVELSHLLFGLGIMHRIMGSHARPGPHATSCFLCGYGQLGDMMRNDPPHRRYGKPKLFGYGFRGSCFVHLRNFIYDIFGRAIPSILSGNVVHSHQFGATFGRACFASDFPLINNFGGEHEATNRARELGQNTSLVPTSRGTKGKLLGARGIDQTFKRMAALLANKMDRFLGAPFARVRVSWLPDHALAMTGNGAEPAVTAIGIERFATTLTSMKIHGHTGLPPSNGIPLNLVYTKVSCRPTYNLEVRGPQSYVANGFVVHNCTDCANLDGRVYRASTWDRFGVLPQARSLACHGFSCRCILIPTDEPCTKGRPPALTGEG